MTETNKTESSGKGNDACFVNGPEPGPMLANIDSPSDLRHIPVDELPLVCADIRDFLIHSLSYNPGHFASSMGVVELTVALHYVFNTPYDRIVWDVGHQAYGHKLVTGRLKNFYTNRKFGGLSGFPNPAESEYDTFIAGHASNSISAALGMAVATQLNGDTPHRKVVAVIGDASISGGLAFEGINNAANTPNDLLIILNDNNMSIDPNVGSLHRYLAQITTSRGYNDMRYSVYNTMQKFNLVNDRRKGAILRFNNSLKSLLLHEQNIFEGLNVRYFGPIDGHDVEHLVKVLNDIKDMKGPRILHIKTKKGKGFAPAEKDPCTWHAPGRFNPDTGERSGSGKNKPAPPKFQDVAGETLVELAGKNQRIVGITAAMPSGTSMNKVMEAYPTRVFDVGISEGHAVTFAGGLAKEGLLPFVAIYSAFLQRGYDHIIHDVATMNLPVTFCIDRAGLVGEDGVTHHGSFDIAYLRPIPGMVISSPRDEMMLRNLLYTAQLRDSGPMAIRYPRGAGSNVDWRNEPERVEIGRGTKMRDGDSVAVLSVGPIYSEVVKAIETLPDDASVAHYDMTFVKPIDEDILQEVARKGCPIVTVEDGTVVGGLGTAVMEWMEEHDYAPHITRIGIPDDFVAQGTVAELRKLCGMDAASIAQAVAEAMQ